MKKPLLTAALMAAACVNAQVDVVELDVPSSREVITSTANSNSSNQQANVSAQGEMYYQLQLLREEVLQLRGLIEEQAFELKRLKQQRLDDYLDLDRRLSAVTTGAQSGQPAASPISESPITSGLKLPASSASADEKTLYRQAIDLVLKQKNYDQAIAEFNNYLSGFPTGQYAANSHYWLGEIFLLKNDLEQARQWFTKLIDGFPNDRKTPDAKFKLGKVYDLMGNQAKAKELLQDVAKTDTDAARLARNYLRDNF